MGDRNAIRLGAIVVRDNDAIGLRVTAIVRSHNADGILPQFQTILVANPKHGICRVELSG